MVCEAVEFAEEDKVMKETIDARNGLEGYAYSMRNTITDTDKLGDKISESDKETIESAIKETLTWLEENPDADKDKYAEKQKELEGICNPIITKLYQEHGGAGAGAGGGAEGGAKFEDDIDSHDEL